MSGIKGLEIIRQNNVKSPSSSEHEETGEV
jgi:hypothetical protein